MMTIVPLSVAVDQLESGSRPRSGVCDLPGVPSLGGEHISADGTIREDGLRYITQSTFDQLRSGKLQSNDILIVKDGATTGKTAFYSDSYPHRQAALNEHVFRVSTNRAVAFPKYVFWYLVSDRGQTEILKDFRGATVGGISRGFIDKASIPLPHKNGKPDLDEQKRIAAILDKADAIRRKRQQALRLTADFLRAVFLDMFGDPEGNGWSMTTVEGVAGDEKGSIRTGPFGSQLLHSEFVEDGIAVLGIDNAVTNQFTWGKPRFITEEKYEELERYTVHPGDVLITIMGTCGRCAVVPDDIPRAINTKHLCCITLNQNKCLPEFLHSYFLIHPIARRYLTLHSKGAIMDGLNMGIIKNLPVPEAPLSLQRDFARIIKQRCGLAARLTSQQDEAEDLFASLQQRAFRGEF